MIEANKHARRLNSYFGCFINNNTGTAVGESWKYY
jgi:hypothetical protein